MDGAHFNLLQVYNEKIDLVGQSIHLNNLCRPDEVLDLHTNAVMICSMKNFEVPFGHAWFNH